MNDDAELLRRYAEKKDEAAFAELVRRHVDLVYAAALRQLGGAAHRAEDVTQGVFTALAQRARQLAARGEIVGWLYTSTHHIAAKLKRGEARRQAREQEASIMQENENNDSGGVAWERLRPVLDEAMLGLPERDREALLLRFFRGAKLGEVGRRLGVSEDAARMRVERALQKLRARLGRRGIDSSMAALVVALESSVATAAPRGVVASATSAALAANGATGTSWLGMLASSKWLVTGAASLGAVVVIEVVGVTGFDSRAAEAEPARIMPVVARAQPTSVSELAPAVAFQIPTSTEAAATMALAGESDAAALATGARALAGNADVRRLVESARHDFLERHRIAVLADMGVSLEERERIAREILARASFAFSRSGSGYRILEQELRSEAQTLALVRRVVGEARFAELLQLRRLEGVRKLAKTLAVLVHPSATPLEPTQAAALMEVAARQARNTMADGRVTLDGIDWSALKQELAGVLAAEQLTALDVARAAVRHRQFGEGKRGIAIVPPEWAVQQQVTELRQLRAELGADNAWFYRAQGLDGPTVEKLEALLMEHEGRRRDLLAVRSSLGPLKAESTVWRPGIASNGSQVRVLDDRAIMTLRAENDTRLQAGLVALLGAGGYGRWKEFEAAEERRGVVMRLVADMALSEVPVSRAQTEKLERVLEAARFTQKFHRVANWGQLLRATEPFLAPQQQEELAAQAARSRRAAAGHELAELLRTLPE